MTCVCLSLPIQYFSSLALSYHFITYAHLGRTSFFLCHQEFLCNFYVSQLLYMIIIVFIINIMLIIFNKKKYIFSTFYYNQIHYIRLLGWCNLEKCFRFYRFLILLKHDFWYFLNILNVFLMALKLFYKLLNSLIILKRIHA